MTIKELDAINRSDVCLYSCMFTVDNVPEEYTNNAKEVDGENYMEDCMVVHAYYDNKNNTMMYNLLYITDDGEDLEWPCKLNEKDEIKMLDMIRKELDYEN